MTVAKRDGRCEEVSFDKVSQRVGLLCSTIAPPLVNIRRAELIIKVVNQFYDGINTFEIDELVAQQSASMSTIHSDYASLASRLVISNLHKTTQGCFYSTIKAMYTATPKALVSKELWDLVEENKERIIGRIEYARDFSIDYFGLKTLERSYLGRIGDRVVERPQDMWMRVSLGIHGTDFEAAFQTYDLMSAGYFTHATPTLFNSGTPTPQLSSCYLLSTKSDSIDGIFDTVKECAQISKWAGGIGLHVSNVRGCGQYIAGTNGSSNGILPMLKVLNSTARYVDQGGGKRNGSIAVYLEPWHSDIESFLDLKKNQGDESLRARDLFLGLWVSDSFMRAVHEDKDWHLMSPDDCPGLSDSYGYEFERLVQMYVSERRYKRRVKARDLWFRILDSQMETGVPYLLFKDAANRKSNQQNLGTIKSSNLCTEIIEYSSPEETAVCNLASVALPRCIDGAGEFDYEKLHTIVARVVRNLDRIIDINYYPTEPTRRSNLLHRPIGVGVQGLADVFARLSYPFDSEKARAMNIRIFATIYHAALSTSCLLAATREESIAHIKSLLGMQSWRNLFREPDNPVCTDYTLCHGMTLEDWNLVLKVRPIPAEMEMESHLGAYSSYRGSPMSEGRLQFDLWENVIPCDCCDWSSLRARISQFGVRNSLLVAPMPTASTAQILGNNECFEPFTSNIYSRRTKAGDFTVINKHLIQRLVNQGVWSVQLKNKIIADNGSVQNLVEVDPATKRIFRTAWEIPNKALIDMAADRAPYICQSQSLNLWMSDPDYGKLTSMHFYSWKKGLKTGIYYLRRRARHAPQQFTLDPEPCLSCSA